jgi:hypothetical protein
MPKPTKQIKSLPPPKGGIPPIIDEWLCVSVNIERDEFTFKKGNETKVKSWKELDKYKTT